jgi:hypothetical protein
VGRVAAGWSVVAVMAAMLVGLGCEGEGGEGGATMSPGEDCLQCHAAGGEAAFSAAGTVVHMDGSGAPGLTVTLTDSASVQAVTTTNSVGNFFIDAALAEPFQVAITDGTTTVEMLDAPGACNSCHRTTGSAQSPIVFP